MKNRQLDSNNSKPKKNDQTEEDSNWEYTGEDSSRKDIPNSDAWREICENPF